LYLKALGSAYFIRRNIPIQEWNFTSKLREEFHVDLVVCLASSFQNAMNRQIFTGNLLNAQTLRKEKFPRDFFPEVKPNKIKNSSFSFISPRRNGLEKVLLKHVGQSMACKTLK
jgi:hypothetical protein